MGKRANEGDCLKGFLLIILIGVGLYMVMVVLASQYYWGNKSSDKNQAESTITENTDSKNKDMTMHIQGEDFIIPAYSSESEDTYRESCISIEDISLLKRYPNEYYGKRYRIDCKINWLSRYGEYKEHNHYKINDHDGYGEFHIVDFRNTDTPRILNDDNITVYGEFIGLYNDEYPLFAMKYADIKAKQ